MPMPPPKPSVETLPSRRRQREVAQLERALRAEGPAADAELRARVGAAYWDAQRFERALQWAIANGRVIVDAQGRFAVT
ncbi:MAG: hypothetical protein ACRDP1_07560 [Nocardioidaceae bacterium]